MLYVGVREIEGSRFERAIFADLGDATEVYEEAAYVVRNAPGEGATDNLTIVTQAFLYAADATAPDLAKSMSEDGHAILLESEN